MMMIEICKMIWWLALGAFGSLILIGLGIFAMCMIVGIGITIKEEVIMRKKRRKR